MKKIIMLSVTFLTMATSLTSMACNNSSLKNLNNIIISKELGTVTVSGLIPTKTELLSSIKEVNSNANYLTVGDIGFNDTPSSTTATIIGIGNYIGLVTLNYNEVQKKEDINKLVVKTSLGQIYTKDSLPTKQQLLDAIKVSNPNTQELTLNDIGFIDIPTITNATLVGIDKFQGVINVSYTLIYQNHYKGEIWKNF